MRRIRGRDFLNRSKRREWGELVGFPRRLRRLAQFDALFGKYLEFRLLSQSWRRPMQKKIKKVIDGKKLVA